MVSLMITRHCLRYSFNLCPKEVKHLKPDPMTLINGNEKLILKFDCKACEMHVVGKMKKGVKLNLGTIRRHRHARKGTLALAAEKEKHVAGKHRRRRPDRFRR
jgi:hypothetical protein